MLTPEREKEIREQQKGPDGCFEIGELLAEIDRLRAEAIERDKTNQQITTELVRTLKDQNGDECEIIF